MMQIVRDYRSGCVRLEDVPVPALKAGGVLVRSAYSLVSSGTKGAAVREASMTLLGMARARPDQVRKVLDSVRTQGLLFQAGNADDLADKARRMIADEGLRREAGCQGRAEYLSRYSPQRNYDLLMDIYHQAVAERAQRRL